MKSPIVALVGKPNIGKSTLFNRMINEKKSIVEDTPGVTRDRIYADCEWLTRHFKIIDTGGLQVKDVPLQKEIEIQAKIAIEEADVIVFLTSIKDGVTPDDKYITQILRKFKGTVILAANKADGKYDDHNFYDLYSLGWGEPVKTSAEHGQGVGNLLDKIVEVLPRYEKVDDDTINFSLIGRPNVGKSSLVNAILGEERSIVSAEQGTTRDAVDTPFKRHGRKYNIIDTAGIRRKGKIYERVEKYSVLRAMKAVDESDVILVVIDGASGIQQQDETVAGIAKDARKPTIIVVNKWDAVKDKDSKTMNKLETEIRATFKFLSYAPIVFVSALENSRIHTVFPIMDEILEMIKKHCNTTVLNDVVTEAQFMNPAPSFKGGRLDIGHVVQVNARIPTFVFFVNDPKYLHFTYSRYIENQIREQFGFTYVPINFVWKKKSARL